MAECVFCRIAAGTLPASAVHRDDAVVAFMDSHSHVIPQRADLDRLAAVIRGGPAGA